MALLLLAGPFAWTTFPAEAQPTSMPNVTPHLEVGFNPVPAGATPFATQNPQATWPVSEYMTYLEKQNSQNTPPTRTTRLSESLPTGEFLEQVQDRSTTMVLSPGRMREMLNEKIPARVEAPQGDKAREPKIDPLSKDDMVLAGLSFFQDIEHHAQLSSQGDKKGTLLIVLKWQIIARNHPDRIEEITRKIAGYHGYKDFPSYINAEVVKHKANL